MEKGQADSWEIGRVIRGSEKVDNDNAIEIVVPKRIAIVNTVLPTGSSGPLYRPMDTVISVVLDTMDMVVPVVPGFLAVITPVNQPIHY